jgi:hypothetical protein
VAVFPGGRILVLDEDEIPETFSSSDKKIVSESRAELIRDFRQITSHLEAKAAPFIERLGR